MQIIKPYCVIMTDFDADCIYKFIENIGRTAYKSEDKITSESAPKFVKMLIERGHESVIEHVNITVRVVCDRGVSHEIVRHRIASYTQESTRYCNYQNKGLTFIEPCFWAGGTGYNYNYDVWLTAMEEIEKYYFAFVEVSPEQARAILPNSLKTEIVMTMNLRQWRHFFKLRTSKEAHPQMREIFVPLLNELKEKLPIIFEGI